MRLKTLIFLTLTSFWGFTEGARASIPVEFDVSSFVGRRGFESAYGSVIRSTKSGTLQAQPSTVRGYVNTDPCVNLLTEFQNEPLKRMLEQGYITPSLHEELSRVSGSVSTSQIRTIVARSELTSAQLKEHFPEGIPHGRQIKEPPQKNGVEREIVARGHLMVVMGQSPQGTEGFRRFRYPWQSWELQKHLANLDTSRIFGAELGRASTELAPLPGSLLEMTEVAVELMESEAFILGIDPRDFVVFGHALNLRTGWYYQDVYGMRVLDQDLKGRLEQDPSGALAQALSAESLSRREFFSLAPDQVLVTSLSELKKRVLKLKAGKLRDEGDLETPQIQGSLSHHIARMREMAPRLSDRQARELILKKFRVASRDLEITFGTSVPIEVSTRAYTEAIWLGLVDDLFALGLSNRQANELLQYLVNEIEETETSLFSPLDRDGLIYAPQASPKLDAYGVLGWGWDHERAKQDPFYLPRVLLGIYSDRLKWLTGLGDQAIENIFNLMINPMRMSASPPLPAVQVGPTMDLEIILNHVPISLVMKTDDEALHKRLSDLGGKKLPLKAARISGLTMTEGASGVDMSLDGSEVDVSAYSFTPEDFKLMLHEHPLLNYEWQHFLKVKLSENQRLSELLRAIEF